MMTHKPNNLSVLSYANGFTLWHYVTDDDWAEVASEGYFDRSCDMLRTGDMLFMNIGMIAATVLVKSNAGGRVVIGNLTNICRTEPLPAANV